MPIGSGSALPGREVLNRSLTEKAWQQQVMGTALQAGWLRHHQAPGMFKDGRYLSAGGDVGFPDLVLSKRGRLVFAELKAQRGIASPAQRVWLEVLASVPGVEVYLWRPSDASRVAAVLFGRGTFQRQVGQTDRIGGEESS